MDALDVLECGSFILIRKHASKVMDLSLKKIIQFSLDASSGVHDCST